MTRKQLLSLLFLAASVIYDFIPVDFIPDIPFVGWLDDTLITSSALLNCIQQFFAVDNSIIQKALKYTKWATLILALIIILALGSIVGLLVSIFTAQ